MSYESLFSLANLAVLPGWLLLAVAPKWRWSQRYAALLIPLVLGPIYSGLLATNWGAGGFGTLEGVAQLFANRGLLLAGWIHYLIFGLFTGSWETRDAAARGIPQLVVIVCLALTFLLGPVGLALYLPIRQPFIASTRLSGRRRGTASRCWPCRWPGWPINRIVTARLPDRRYISAPEFCSGPRYRRPPRGR